MRFFLTVAPEEYRNLLDLSDTETDEGLST